MADRQEPFTAALEAYRDGRRQLDLFKDDPRDRVQIYLDEIREVLLDLKQAVLGVDVARTDEHVAELNLVLIELYEAVQGDDK